MNPDSSAPVLRLADRIRELGLFREVVCAFWKEQPSFTDFWHSLDSREVFLVPVFISEGYFCQEVLPRELGLTGPVTLRDGVTIHYCRPVGGHPMMSRLLLDRAESIAPAAPKSETALIIVGHGTSLNDNSKAIVQEQAERVRAAGYAEVHAAFMEEAPFIADWDKITSCPHVVVTPFFVSDGLHSYQDIPVLLGLETEPTEAASQRAVFRDNPRRLRDRDLYYSGAIGADPGMVDVILSLVQDCGSAPSEPDSHPHRLDVWLNQQLSTDRIFGQLAVVSKPDGWRLGHQNDLDRLDSGDLRPLTQLEELRSLVFFAAEGAYRPLKSAPNLPSGWQADFSAVRELRLWMDEAQPGQIGLAAAENPHPVALRAMLARQTGMYRFAAKISNEGAARLVKNGPCAPNHCTRRIIWPLEFEEKPPVIRPAPSAWICREACALLLGEAREVSRAESLA